jgi:indolepyruvate ferredoxin oxidoreductase
MTDEMLKDSYSLKDRFTREEGEIYLTGIQALVRLPIDQRRADLRSGLRTAGLISGYPGSPVGGYDIEIARCRSLLQANDIQHMPGLNEDLAATALWGTQMLHVVGDAKYDGVFGLWYGKAPGVDRTGDAFRHGNIRGVGKNGGVLAIAGDDPKPVSSMFPSDSNFAFYDFQMPVLCPGDVQEILDLGLHGYAMSRASGLWVGFKIVSSVADSAGTATVAPDRIRPIIPALIFENQPFQPTIRVNEAGAAMIEAERDLFYERIELARRYSSENHLNVVTINPSDAWLGIVAVGKTYFDLRQSLRDLGLSDSDLNQHGIRLLKIAMPFPMDSSTIRDFARGLREILVIEEKRPFVELFFKDVLYGSGEAPVIVGKHDETGAILVRAHSDLDPDIICGVVASRLNRKGSIESVTRRLALIEQSRIAPVQLSTSRSPYFCSGCPHSRSLVVSDDTVVGAGIGCHIMALYMGKETFGKVTGYTQMGGEGAQWAGLAPFTRRLHFVQNLGDGTFTHSGSLAIRFAVAAGTNVTYKLLYNQAISMTGGQEIVGVMSIPALSQMLKAEGVRKIVVTTEDPDRYNGVVLSDISTVRHRDDILDAERELADQEGVTVLIHDQRCAAETRRLRKRKVLPTPDRMVVINERVCEGCGDCGRKSNCLSVQPVETEFGRKTQIHLPSCNRDFSCLLGDCPSFLTIEGADAPQKKTPPERIPFVLPPPPERQRIAEFNVLMTGIGGTGVVTINQILSTAAMLDGYQIRALDVTGFSQKAGPVISEFQIFHGSAERSNMLTAGSVHLYLVFDLLVGVDATHLRKTDPRKSVAIVSTSEVATGRMVADTKVHYPDISLLKARINNATLTSENKYIDNIRIAETLIGDHMAGNMVLVGAAFQAGQLPIDEQAIEQAIRLNGTAVDMNLHAFRLGRLGVADPERMRTLLEGPTPPAADDAEPPEQVCALIDGIGAQGELRRLLAIRAAELIAYHSMEYARSYVEFVGRIHDIEGSRIPGRNDVACAVARNLYKLMAYKDEYEVARLLLLDAQRARIHDLAGATGKIYWHLHPTFLRILGFKRKVKLGPAFTPVLKLLRALKWLRGTRLDLFGYGKIRALERALILDYRRMIQAAMTNVSGDNHDRIVQLANLPDIIRGYEGVKVDSTKEYMAKVRDLLRDLGLSDEKAAKGQAFDIVADKAA